jgi:hypothetical protein
MERSLPSFLRVAMSLFQPAMPPFTSGEPMPGPPVFCVAVPPEPPGTLQEMTMATVTGSPVRVWSMSATSNSNEAESQGSRPGATPVRAAGRQVDDASRTFYQPQQRWDGYAARVRADGGGSVLV